MILYKNTKKKRVRSSDDDTDFFNDVAEIIQRDTLMPKLFIIWLY